MPGLLDFKMSFDSLNVVDKVPGGVVFDAGSRRAFSGASLIEQDDPVLVWVEVATVVRVDAAAGASVKEDDGFALRVSGLFDVQFVAVTHVQAKVIVGLDVWVQKVFKCFLHG